MGRVVRGRREKGGFRGRESRKGKEAGGGEGEERLNFGYLKFNSLYKICM